MPVVFTCRSCGATLEVDAELEGRPVACGHCQAEQRVPGPDPAGSEEAERHLAAGQFPPGSMGPKITAALNFLRHGGHRAIITSARLLRATADGMRGAGTCIERSPVPMAHLS